MSNTVSEVIVETLVAAGAKRCYGIVGDTINQFTTALRESELEWVHVRHEEVGAFAAGAEAYMTGELAVCAGTSGPGSLHFLNGIVESNRNGSPLVLIASNIERVQQGFNFIQEIDQEKFYEHCSVFCERITHPEQARRMTAMAVQAALVKKGVAVLVVNGDMFTEKTHDKLPWSVHRCAPIIRPSDAEIEQLAQLVNDARKVVLFAGIGARGAHDQVIALAERINAPVAHTTRAKEFIEPNNPFNVGMSGILGNRAAVDAMDNCDLLLCLGSDFAYTEFYPEKAKIVQVDINPTNLGRRIPLHLGLHGDVGATLDALLPSIEEKKNGRFLDKALKQWKDDKETYQKRVESKDPELIHPQLVTQMLDRLADEDAAFTADVGTPMVWLLRHLSANGKRSFLTSLLHGTMANAYPQAIGISKAYPGRQVIAMCGDGGMTMLMGDLMTIAQEKLPVKLMVFNNHSLSFVEMEQRVEGLLDSFTRMDNPDFSALAESCGIYGTKVDRADDLETTMHQWLAHDGPALLDVQVNAMEFVMPPKIELGQVTSTAKFGIKAVLSGRTDEVYSLFRKNFWG